MLTKNIDRMKSEIARHIAADAVVCGSYWNETDNDVGGQSCFIGCLAHSSNAAALEGKYGLPLMLTRILEDIFERLPTDEQPVFFREIGDAIGCDGRDLTLVQWAFLEDVLRHLPVQNPEITAVIDPVIEGMHKLATGGVWGRDKAVCAARAAYAADAYAAYVAGDSARAVVYAADAADAADDDVYAADAYADAAAYAATKAADDAATRVASNATSETQRQRAAILRLIESAPVMETRQ